MPRLDYSHVDTWFLDTLMIALRFVDALGDIFTLLEIFEEISFCEVHKDICMVTACYLLARI